MTNGSDETTSQETDKKYVSQRGTAFEIEKLPNGLWGIRMLKGGSVPQICEGLYTERFQAEKALVRYLQKGDKLGYAKYPTIDD